MILVPVRFIGPIIFCIDPEHNGAYLKGREGLHRMCSHSVQDLLRLPEVLHHISGPCIDGLLGLQYHQVRISRNDI